MDRRSHPHARHPRRRLDNHLTSYFPTNRKAIPQGVAFSIAPNRGGKERNLSILNKGKPKHMKPRRRWRTPLTALAIAVSMAFAPAAMADMDGYDISNWQCGIDTATVPADFVIVGTTWGSGGVYGGCLSNGVNTDANRQLAGAINSGKETGVYHYALGGNPETEARFFVDNVRGYVHRSVLILDWEA